MEGIDPVVRGGVPGTAVRRTRAPSGRRDPLPLTRQLRELERDGFLHRQVYGEVPPRVEYTLTPLGESFAPLLHAMLEWSRDHLEQLSGDPADAGGAG